MKSWTAHAAPAAAALGITAALVGVGLASVGVLPPLLGFALFALGTLLGGLLAVLLGLVGLLRTRRSSGRSGAGRAGMGIGIGLLIFVFLALLRPPPVPAIHDITTSPGDPPSFVAALAEPGNQGRDLTYPHGPAETPDLQREAYPDLAPIESSLPPAEAFARSADVAGQLGWEIIDRDEPERLEATFTSRNFRFVDDIVVRLRPNERTGGTTIDLRSTSRVGQSDLGANAARIRAFAEAFGEG